MPATPLMSTGTSFPPGILPSLAGSSPRTAAGGSDSNMAASDDGNPENMPPKPRRYRHKGLLSEGALDVHRASLLGCTDASSLVLGSQPTALRRRQAALRLPSLEGIDDVSARLRRKLQPAPLPGDKLANTKKKRRKRKGRAAVARACKDAGDPMPEARATDHQIGTAAEEEEPRDGQIREERVLRVILDGRDAKVVKGSLDFTRYYRRYASAVKERLPMDRQEKKPTETTEEGHPEPEALDTSYLLHLGSAGDDVAGDLAEMKVTAEEWAARPKRIEDILLVASSNEEQPVMRTLPGRELGPEEGAPPLWMYSTATEPIPLHLQPCILSVLDSLAATLIDGSSQQAPPVAVIGSRPLGMDCNALEELLMLRSCSLLHLLSSGHTPQERKGMLSRALVDLIEETTVTSRATGAPRASSNELLRFKPESSIRMVPNLCQHVDLMNAAHPGPLPPTVKHGLVLNLNACQLGSSDIPCVVRVLEMSGRQICRVLLARPGAYGAEPQAPQSCSRRLSQNLELSTANASVVTQLHLSGNCLSDAGVTGLALCLRELPWVKVLDLSNNKGLTWRCCKALAEVLRPADRQKGGESTMRRHRLQGAGLSAIADLCLDGVAVGDKGLELMAASLLSNRSLTRWSLQSAGITSASAACLKRLMERNDHLQELRLGWNQLQGSGGQALATGIQHNSALLSLALPNNGLTDVGGSFVALALQYNTSLRELDLSSNGLGLKTCLVLNESLLRNNTLETLHLNSNPLGAEGGRHLLARFLSRDSSLHCAGLHNASFVDHCLGSSAAPMFDPTNPNGSYRLNLGDPASRQVAVSLTRLYYQHGPKSWRCVQLDGKHMKAPEKEWPDTIPTAGTLCLTFEATIAPEASNAVPAEEDFDFIVKELQHPANDDFWRMSLLRIMCSVCSLTAAQAKEALVSFTWPSQALEAAKLLFLTVIDVQNVGVLVSCLAEGDQRKLYQHLGAAAFFRAENPAGHYSLNLRRQVDRSVATRLVAIARREGQYWRRAPTICHNFRNVKLDGSPLDILDPISFVLPGDGQLVLDFISYSSGALLSARYLPPARAASVAIADSSGVLRLQASIRALQEWEDQKSRGNQQESEPEADLENCLPQSAREMFQRSVLRANMRSQLRMDPLRFVVTKGVSMRNLLSSADQWRSEYEEEKKADPVMDAEQFKRIMQEIDRAADEQMKLAAVRKAAMQKVQRVSTRIKSLNMTYEGLAQVWDDSVSFVSPLSVVKMFAAQNYCLCSHVLALLSGFDVDNERQSAARVDIVQALFARIADPWHFLDILRSMSAVEQLQTLQRNGYLNCIPRNRRGIHHLHGLVFLIRMSVKEESIIFKYLTDRLLEIPNKVSPGNPVALPIFSELMISGREAQVLEDGRFWQTVCLMAKDRPRPDDSWDPLGTVEFVVAIPRHYLVSQAAIRLQATWRAFIARRDGGQPVDPF